MSAIIEIENLSFGYTTPQKILKDISFEVEKGSFLAIAGPNGAGKSTLLNLLCANLKLKTGKIRIGGKSVKSYSAKALAKKVAVVRQEFVPVFGFSVIDTVMMARTAYFGQSGFATKADIEQAEDALRETDTINFASRPLDQLSGGERQRVFIARAIAQNTDILLLDEPTSHLDLKHQAGIYDLLKQMQLEKGKTIVAVSHDVNLAAQYADSALLLASDGGYHIGRIEEVFSSRQIAQAFGVRVFEAEIGTRKIFLPIGKFAKHNE